MRHELGTVENCNLVNTCSCSTKQSHDIQTSLRQFIIAMDSKRTTEECFSNMQ